MTYGYIMGKPNTGDPTTKQLRKNFNYFLKDLISKKTGLKETSHWKQWKTRERYTVYYIKKEKIHDKLTEQMETTH